MQIRPNVLVDDLHVKKVLLAPEKIKFVVPCSCDILDNFYAHYQQGRIQNFEKGVQFADFTSFF